jgi:hypothetical protein
VLLSQSLSVPALSPSGSLPKKARLSSSGHDIGSPEAVNTAQVVLDPVYGHRGGCFDVSNVVFGVSNCIVDESDEIFGLSDPVSDISDPILDVLGFLDVSDCVLVDVRPQDLFDLGISVQLKHEVISFAPEPKLTSVNDILIPKYDVVVSVPQVLLVTSTSDRNFSIIPDDIADLLVASYLDRAFPVVSGDVSIDICSMFPEVYPDSQFDSDADFIPSVEDIDESLFVNASVVLPMPSKSDLDSARFGTTTTAELENVRRGGVCRSEAMEKWAT